MPVTFSDVDYKEFRKACEYVKCAQDSLRHLNTRYTNKFYFSSYIDMINKKKRSIVSPFEYYSFRFFDVFINIEKRCFSYSVVVNGWSSVLHEKDRIINSNATSVYFSSKDFSFVKKMFLELVSEFLDSFFAKEACNKDVLF